MKATYSTLAALGLLGAAACAPAAPPAEPAPATAPTAPAVPAAPARQAPPPPLAARQMTFPAYTETTLPNGLRMLVVPNPSLPVLNATLFVNTGSAADPRDHAGLAGMTADLLTKGTTSRTARQIAERIEGVGGSIGAGADQDDITVTAGALSDQDTLVFSLLADVVQRPAFAAGEIQTVRAQTLSALRTAQGTPGAIAGRTFARNVYGAHPYGTLAEPATVERIDRADLQRFHRAHFTPANAMLVVSGDVTPERARELAMRHFGAWRGGAAPAVAMPAVPQPGAGRIILVHRPGSVQSNVVVGHPGLRPDNPDYFAVRVMNQILGGGTDSRLFQILRQQKGWTYGAYSGYSRPRDVGTFQATAEVRNAVTDSALTEILAQMRSVRDQPVSEEEFQAAKSYLTGSFPLRFETPGQIASQIASTRLLGLPVEHLTGFRERIEAVTREDVQRVAGTYLHPDRATIVIVGDAPQVLPKLQGMGPVTVMDVEGKTVDPASFEVRASTDRFDASGLAPMTLNYGIVFQGNTVAQATTVLARDGETWVATQTAPGNSRSEVRFTNDFTPVSTTQAAPAAGLEVTLRFENGRVVGSAKLPAAAGGDKTVDTEVVAGTRFGEMASWILAASDLAEGRTITIPVFSVMSNAVSNMTARVVGSEQVTVPAGTFDTWKVEMAGGDAPATLYLRKTAPHIVVKQVLTAQPVSIELQSMQ